MFATIRYFDRLEAQTPTSRTYMPPMEEILEDVVFDLDSTNDEETDDE